MNQRTGQVKILFISKHIPYRADSGITVKMRNLLACMSGGFPVACAFLVDERGSNGADLDQCRLNVSNYLIETEWEPNAPRRYLSHLLELFFVSNKVRNALSDIVAAEKPDIVWLEFGYIGNLIPFMKKFGIPVIYGSHNSQFKLDFGIWRSNGNIGYRLRMAPFVLLYLIHERLYFRLADRVLCISRQDMGYHARFIDPARLRLLPFLFDGRDPADIPPHEAGHPYVCMVGSLRAYQNFAAVMYAVEEICPILFNRDDRLRLYVVGELPEENSPEHRRLVRGVGGTGRVVLTGRVESVIPFVKGAVAQLVALSIGSGVRTKIIESAASGTPVVSTSIGAEGLPFVDGESILIADTADALAEGILRLVNDETLRREMAEKAIETYRRELSFEAGTRIITELIGELGLRAA